MNKQLKSSELKLFLKRAQFGLELRLLLIAIGSIEAILKIQPSDIQSISPTESAQEVGFDPSPTRIFAFLFEFFENILHNLWVCIRGQGI